MRSNAYTALQLSFSITPIEGGVAIEADALALWLSPRDALLTVPSNVTTVDIFVRPTDNKPPLRRTLGAADASDLANIINHLMVAADGIAHCGHDNGSYDTLVFHDRESVRSFTVENSGCLDVTVGVLGQTTQGTTEQRLEAGTLPETIFRMMGIPAT
jgi:hypothetical protein